MRPTSHGSTPDSDSKGQLLALAARIKPQALSLVMLFCDIRWIW